MVKQSKQDTAMSTIHGITELGPATAKPQVYPFEKYWVAFLEWRKRVRLRTELCHLTDSEPADIGITRGETITLLATDPSNHEPFDPPNLSDSPTARLEGTTMAVSWSLPPTVGSHMRIQM